MKFYEDTIPDVSEIFQAYFDCRRGKRNSEHALLYELNFEERLFELYEKLITQSYIPGKSIFFILNNGKPREVWASEFEDRIVHHLLYNRLYTRFVNSFIFDSYSCIPNKGTHRAVDRLDYFVRSVTKNYSTPCYYLQCDIQTFYININKDILYNIIIKKVKNVWWRWLIHTILYSDPRDNYVCNSPDYKVKLIPHHKSLFSKPPNTGLPIGNLSSQFFANIYLNELDQYCKHRLKTKYYIRYADDIVILHENSKTLNEIFNKMDSFVRKNLKLNFHPNKKIIQPTENGINFVGYIIKHYHRYIRNSTVHNFKNKNYKTLDNPISTINSYFGFFKYANCYTVKNAATKTFLSNFKFDKNISKVIT